MKRKKLPSQSTEALKVTTSNFSINRGPQVRSVPRNCMMARVYTENQPRRGTPEDGSSGEILRISINTTTLGGEPELLTKVS